LVNGYVLTVISYLLLAIGGTSISEDLEIEIACLWSWLYLAPCPLLRAPISSRFDI